MFEHVEAALRNAATAWQRYESGMDWDASYLSSMGTLDTDTEEYYDVFMAMKDLEQAYAQDSADVKPEYVKVGSALEKAQFVLRAYHEFSDAGWSVWGRDGEAAKLAAQVSELLGVPFAGRCGGGSTNDPC